MTIEQFSKKVDLIRTKNSILFGLDADTIPSHRMIHSFEKGYGLTLPTQYKEFLGVYGGGYFAYVSIYSIDVNSEFYLKSNVTIEEVKRNSYLPIIDLNTGDTLGFRLVEGEYCESIVLFNHEDNRLIDTKLDFFETLCKYGLKLIL